jgi:hypothetical protein
VGGQAGGVHQVQLEVACRQCRKAREWSGCGGWVVKVVNREAAPAATCECGPHADAGFGSHTLSGREGRTSCAGSSRSPCCHSQQAERQGRHMARHGGCSRERADKRARV